MTSPAPPPTPPSASRWEAGRLRLSPSLVWTMALSSLRLRFVRSLLTMLTLATASAFLIYLLLLPPTDDAADRNAWRLMFALSLIVSTAGVMNTMLMSVTQRYREIGTIKCLGALNSFVLLSVLLEAALLGLAGALLGVVAGFVIAMGVGALQHGAEVLTHLDFTSLPLKLSFALSVGLGLATLGAALPALIAARMPPMEAMRGEK